jgi:hypothetical protein
MLLRAEFWDSDDDILKFWDEVKGFFGVGM